MEDVLTHVYIKNSLQSTYELELNRLRTLLKTPSTGVNMDEVMRCLTTVADLKIKIDTLKVATNGLNSNQQLLFG